MKIDLHLHTNFSKQNGDSIQWFGYEKAIKNMHAQKIRAFSFTDHNHFDAELYLNSKKICENKITIFPGVEINIKKQDGIIAHLLVLFDNNLSDDLIYKLQDITKNSLRKRGVLIEKVYEFYKEYDFIVIPHVGKGDFFKPDELNFRHEAIEISSETNANYKSWLKKLNNKSVVAFSDTHIWEEYPQIKNLETFINFDGTFQGLKDKLKENKNYTKEK